MKNLLIGQGHDLLWVNLMSVPTAEEYLRMVDGSRSNLDSSKAEKCQSLTRSSTETGGLFRMISRLVIAQSQSPNKPADLDRLMTLLGRYFQIRDDYANLVLDQVCDPHRGRGMIPILGDSGS